MNTKNNAQSSMYPIRKSAGVNDSEKKLIKLCRHTFLDLWSFPNPHQRKGTHKPELCDLLVICDPHVIIFSDKSCEYRATNDPILAWKRWYKNAILDSIHQLYGAERIINQFPQRIFLDRHCTQPLPLPIPPSNDIQIHRIVVAGGAASECRKERGGSGSLSLMVDPTESNSSRTTVNPILPPFTISHFGKPNQFVHVVDEVSLKILLSELDTITDFIHYLEKKEQFILSGHFEGAAGEENLLAYYFGNVNEQEEHDFVSEQEQDQESIFLFDDTHWRNLRQNKQFQMKKQLDKVSYLWDSIIDTAAKYINQGTMRSDSYLTYEEQQMALRIMAREDRFRRRMLSDAILEFQKKMSLTQRGTRILLSNTHPDVGYVYHLQPMRPDESDEQYWKFRHEFVALYCLVVAYIYPDLKYVIGIATENGINNKKRSYDFLYLKSSTLSSEDFAQAATIQKELGIHQKENLTVSEGMYDEYPAEKSMNEELEVKQPLIVQRPNTIRVQKIGRNWPCPCGSGKKYKKCCGR